MITAVKVAVVLLVIVVGRSTSSRPTTRRSSRRRESVRADTARQSLFSLITGARGQHVTAGTACWRARRSCSSRSSASTSSPPRPRRRRTRSATCHAASWLAGDRHRALRRGGGGADRHGALHRAQGREGEPRDRVPANGVDWAANVISIGALAGLTTVVMVLLLGQIRVLFAMSRDGLLPRGMAKTGQHGTPVRITVLVGVVSRSLRRCSRSTSSRRWSTSARCSRSCWCRPA